MPWAEVAAIAIYLRTPPGGRRPPRDHLVFRVRDASALLDPWEDVDLPDFLEYWELSSVKDAAIALPLQKVVAQEVTPEVRARVLQRIQDVFGPEVQRHAITLDDTLHEL